MKKIFIVILMVLSATLSYAQKDTIYVSNLYTSHIIFATPVTYLDLSNPEIVTGQVIEENKNMIAIISWEPFKTTCSLSALESNGNLHTFIVKYAESPQTLIIDRRPVESVPASLQKKTAEQGSESGKSSAKNVGKGVSNLHYSDAPQLKDIIEKPRDLYHIATKQYDIRVSCQNIYAYSDITYIVLEIENRSSISYETETVSFTVESRKRGRRTLDYNNTLVAKSKYGSFTAAAGESSRIVYSFDKITLTRDQVLKIYINEAGGQRELSLTLNSDDINKALKPF